MSRRAFPTLAAIVLPALLLAGCGEPAPSEPPLPPEALAAVSKAPGVPREKLARAVDELFTREGIGETRAVLVLHDGETAAERYADGYGPRTKFLGWSMSKTVTAVMIGKIMTARTTPPVKMVPPPAGEALPLANRKHQPSERLSQVATGRSCGANTYRPHAP